MTWSTVKTEGIVLRVDPLREYDRRYKMLTPEFGKIEFVGRGAQKEKAKLAAHLEPFAVVDVEIVRGRRSTTVISVERQKPFRQIASNLDRRLLAQSSLTLLDRYTREDDQDEALYGMLLDWLNFLDQDIELGPARRAFLLSGFVMRCFKYLGYNVALNSCLACKQPIVPLAFRWHGGKGGLVCSDCVAKDREEWFAARRLPEEVIIMLRFAREAAYEDILKVPLKHEIISSFVQIVHDLTTYHLPGEYRTPFWTGVMADYVLEVPEESL
ncbi:MAG: DNA repair protein RecO [Patescibacteria group bacterium]